MSAPHLPTAEDLWADVPAHGLPAELLDAAERRDWSEVGSRLALATRGVFGRQTVQFRSHLPLGVDPTIDMQRGWSSISYGDWDGVREAIEARPVDMTELAGLRDILLAPLRRKAPPHIEKDLPFLLGPWELTLDGRIGRYRRLLRAWLGIRSDEAAAERGIPASRHARYRRLQDAALLAIQEAIGGRLPVARGLAGEAQRLGDEGDVLRVLAHDFETSVRHAQGEAAGQLDYPAHLASPHGHPPLDAANFLLDLAPFLALREDGLLQWAARLAERIATRFGSPRMLVRAQTWRIVGDARRAPHPELPALVVQARQAGPGLLAVPLLLDGIARSRHATLAEAERNARVVGNVLAQVSALSWMIAIDPDERTGHRLVTLLRISGWRRPVLVPGRIAAECALGLTGLGLRDRSIVELAAVAGRPNVTMDVAERHLEGSLPDDLRVAAVEALTHVGTLRSRQLLARVARRTDAAGKAAALASSAHHADGLSERELEVLDLAAQGLTNKAIAERLSLSPHTVAHHLANARDKLGAANRAEAAAQIRRLRAEE